MDDEQTVERVAKAIYETAVKRVHQQVCEVAVDAREIQAVFQQAIEESDRAACITLFALLEGVIIAAYRRQLSGDVRGGIEAILDNNGPLGTAHARITMLAA